MYTQSVYSHSGTSSLKLNTPFNSLRAGTSVGSASIVYVYSISLQSFRYKLFEVEHSFQQSACWDICWICKHCICIPLSLQSFRYKLFEIEHSFQQSAGWDICWIRRHCIRSMVSHIYRSDIKLRNSSPNNSTNNRNIIMCVKMMKTITYALVGDPDMCLIIRAMQSCIESCVDPDEKHAKYTQYSKS